MATAATEQHTQHQSSNHVQQESLPPTQQQDQQQPLDMYAVLSFGLDTLRQIFYESIEHGEFETSLHVADSLELALEDIDNVAEKCRFTTLYLALLLYAGNLQGAKYLWKRTSNGIKEHGDLIAVWAIVTQLLEGQIDQVSFKVATDEPYLRRVLENVHVKNCLVHLDIISQHFRNIHVDYLVNLLKLEKAACLGECQNRGWMHNDETGYIHVTKPQFADNQNVSSVIHIITDLSQFAANLENNRLILNSKGLKKEEETSAASITNVVDDGEMYEAI